MREGKRQRKTGNYPHRQVGVVLTMAKRSEDWIGCFGRVAVIRTTVLTGIYSELVHGAAGLEHGGTTNSTRFCGESCPGALGYCRPSGQGERLCLLISTLAGTARAS